MKKNYFSILSVFLLFASSLYGIADIRNYLPATWNANTDLKSYIQTALNTEDVKFYGSGNPYSPLVYPTTAGLVIPEGRRVVIAADSQVKRLPSTGVLFEMYDSTELSCDAFGTWQGQINGNKAAHWPSYPDLGKHSGEAVHVRADASNCLVKKIYVFDNPGTAFGVFGDDNIIDLCKAENCGYIDLKFGADYYQAAWDFWSGDGFYAGDSSGNLFKNCTSIDAFRWDYVPSHSSLNNTFTDCTGEDINFRTYGFVDFEDTMSDGNNTIIRCDNLGSFPGSNGNRVAFNGTNSAHLDDCDLGDSHISFRNTINSTINDVSMSYIFFNRRIDDPAQWGDLTFTGTNNINGSVTIENGQFELVQNNGIINILGDINDVASYYPEPNTSYIITQNSGTMNVSGQITLGYRDVNSVDANLNLNGGTLNFVDETIDSKLICGRYGDGNIEINNGSTITEQTDLSVPMALRWFEESSATLKGYGSVGLTGWFVNNGKVIADGYGQQRNFDLSSFSSINEIFSVNGETAPVEIENLTDNGWYAVNKGSLILPSISVNSGNTTVNWGENPVDSQIDLVNSANINFTSVSNGELNISLLASDSNEARADNIASLWKIDFTGTFNSAVLTFRYDPAAIGALGIEEQDIRVFQFDNQFKRWFEITATVNTTTKHITTEPVTEFSYFAISEQPQGCGNTGTYMEYDICGPNGEPDCYVDMLDFSCIALGWLSCADPTNEPDCYDLYDLDALSETWLQCSDPLNADCEI